MKRVLLILSILFLSGKAAIQAHDLNFGLFELYEKEQFYFMQIRLDKDNLVQAVGNDVGSTKEDWNCGLTQYLNNHIRLAINGNKATLEYTEIDFHEEVVIITAKLDLPHMVISEITVDNTVLLEIMENQTNIIKATFHDKKRSFRLNKDRVSTVIKYEI